ncbi:MAG: hypothetical protein GY768_32675 [Planctomycetaceae bacterium]|nr:hypothetical protein [Planctomycetaceae bacterium]
MSTFVLRGILLSLVTIGIAQGETIVVAPHGADDALGSDERPLRTISAAAERAMPGDTILVRAGIYRERVTPPRGGTAGKPITYRGEKLGKVLLRGSTVWKPAWQSHKAGIVFATPEEDFFNDDVYVDHANPFRVELASTPYERDGKPESQRYDRGDPKLTYTCGQVIVNGKPWQQRPFLSEVETRPGTWTFVAAKEDARGRIYVNFGNLDPLQQQVEISTRRRIFAPHVRGLGFIHVEGFVMEHCGNQYPTNFWNTPEWSQSGALGLRGGHHWIVRNNVFRYANTVALDLGAGGGDNEREREQIGGAPFGDDNLIEENWFLDNGSAAIIGSGSQRVVVRGNVILRNNTLHFNGPKRYEHAGIKFHFVRDGLIEGNYVADNPLSEGIWLDNQFPGTRVTRNVVVNNGARGIFLEMSDYKFDTVLVDHNISVGNRGIQFYVHDASGSTVMHNLFANSPADAKYGQGAYIYQVTARTKTGYHSIYNNLFVNHKVMLDINYPSHRSGPQRLDHNIYDATPNDRLFIINSASDRPSPWKPKEFFALIQREIDSDGPQPLQGGSKVALTLDEWRKFWAVHGLQNDRDSVLIEGMKVSYDQSLLELRVTLPFDPKTVGSTRYTRMDYDFAGLPVPQDGNALPGPFQSMGKGHNRLEIWNGLPLLAEGMLP